MTVEIVLGPKPKSNARTAKSNARKANSEEQRAKNDIDS
jgi:hypothetical protein